MVTSAPTCGLGGKGELSTALPTEVVVLQRWSRWQSEWKECRASCAYRRHHESSEPKVQLALPRANKQLHHIGVVLAVFTSVAPPGVTDGPNRATSTAPACGRMAVSAAAVAAAVAAVGLFRTWLNVIEGARGAVRGHDLDAAVPRRASGRRMAAAAARRWVCRVGARVGARVSSGGGGGARARAPPSHPHPRPVGQRPLPG